MRLSIGRLVHFVQNGVHYPALIVKVWTDTCVNLRVFPNGSDPITPGALDSTDIAHSVNQSETPTCPVCGTYAEWSWHWPELVK